jgi:hypothetical protein
MPEASYVQNTAILHFTQVFYQDTPAHVILRARGGLRELSDRAQRMETNGSLLGGATVHAIASVYKRSFIGGI